MIDFELTDEQQLIRETAREFSDREIAPRARENDRNEHFDTELVQKMADMGFLGAIVPEEYGGRGVDYLTYGLIVEEIGRNDSAMRTVSRSSPRSCAPRSSAGAPRSRSRSGCRSSARARRSAASASPSRTPAPTPPT